MRRYAHCLILLMAPFAASAAAAFDDSRGACVYSANETANAPRTPAATAAAGAAKPAQARPAAAAPGSGGGGDDDVLQRIRAPKWHSFLPGMFR